MSYYVCKGKVNRFATIGKPIYHQNHFADFYDYFVGYAKSPQELNLNFPFPQEFTDIEGRIWLLKDGEKPDNHQFHRSRELPFNSQLSWIPRNREKLQESSPKWTVAEMTTTWKALKQKGEL